MVLDLQGMLAQTLRIPCLRVCNAWLNIWSPSLFNISAGTNLLKTVKIYSVTVMSSFNIFMGWIITNGCFWSICMGAEMCQNIFVEVNIALLFFLLETKKNYRCTETYYYVLLIWAPTLPNIECHSSRVNIGSNYFLPLGGDRISCSDVIFSSNELTQKKISS